MPNFVILMTESNNAWSKSLAAAVTLARGCPALIHGEAVTVRPLGHM